MRGRRHPQVKRTLSFLRKRGFIVTYLDETKLRNAGPFAMTLARQWMAAHPRSPFASTVHAAKRHQPIA